MPDAQVHRAIDFFRRHPERIVAVAPRLVVFTPTLIQVCEIQATLEQFPTAMTSTRSCATNRVRGYHSAWWPWEHIVIEAFKQDLQRKMPWYLAGVESVRLLFQAGLIGVGPRPRGHKPAVIEDLLHVYGRTNHVHLLASHGTSGLADLSRLLVSLEPPAETQASPILSTDTDTAAPAAEETYK